MTLAGVSAQSVPTLRDGIMVQDQRWPTGINTATVINPDLVGEIRLIVSPVDAELGRGNGAIQIQTRSGTNQFRGAAVWNIQNTALNPNSWTGNRPAELHQRIRTCNVSCQRPERGLLERNSFRFVGYVSHQA